MKQPQYDNTTPAGQVVHEDAGQRKLSDYIRSIKRAEAFDNIARETLAAAQEQKLTFDEWLGGAIIYYSLDEYTAMRTAWFAALTKGKL